MAEKEPLGAQRIIGQYRQVIGVLENMFQIATPKMTEQSWRKDGVGSCNVDTRTAEGGLIGNTRGELTRLREERNAEHGGQSTASPCSYHRECYGCVLGDLKSPTCVTFVENPDEWRTKFGIDIQSISKSGRLLLTSIQLGETLEDTTPIEEFTQRIDRIIQRIEGGPVSEDGTLRDKTGVLWRNINSVPKRLYNGWVKKHA